MDEIYLKIYVENGDTLVFEGQGSEDKKGYYPDTLENTRLGTTVVGKEHITITNEAINAFRRIVREANHTGDDISCLDIHICYNHETQLMDAICVSYLGEYITKWNIEEVIIDKNFFIGTGEGLPQVSLLNALTLVD